MRLAGRVRALEQRAAEAPPCGCPVGTEIDYVFAGDGEEPPPKPPCPVCGHETMRVVIHTAVPPALRGARP